MKSPWPVSHILADKKNVDKRIVTNDLVSALHRHIFELDVFGDAKTDARTCVFNMSKRWQLRDAAQTVWSDQVGNLRRCGSIPNSAVRERSGDSPLSAARVPTRNIIWNLSSPGRY
jgi:hypothetical protein